MSPTVLRLTPSFLFAVAAAFGTSGQALAAATAADYPVKPVRLVIPFPPGGPTDITARVIGEALSRKWAQPVVMENRSGAGGNVGAAAISQAPADGYNLVLGVTGSHAINVSLYKNLPYDPRRDFEPISLAVIYPNAILAHPDVPANGLQDLIALAKAEPQKYSYGSDGNGAATHLTMELLKARAGVELTHIPYRGSSPMLNDLAGGSIPVGITGLPSAEAFIQGGQVKLIAITTARDESGKGYRSIAEQGFPDFAIAPWSGFFAPKGTPGEIVEKISADINAVMADPAVRDRLESLGLTPMANTPAEFADFLDAQISQWAQAVQLSGARVD
ncbi:tripartite tricarboxylate transporter substrate binding protein [Verticiella sediminum]|uniref:Tripartite tricarboxylate transporter substrate binding protein n=1 Tax=Verticiella sediminum TaxID=1247510 RepID=A0A556AIE3_9BURK|nr:tripartite tricarboxylate transporter substrate binding protein [Verticiella sediminum]TSH92664.1 tripartite tricarboxylate transporter substrate binding protein [Verticiella sediminum]